MISFCFLCDGSRSSSGAIYCIDIKFLILCVYIYTVQLRHDVGSTSNKSVNRNE